MARARFFTCSWVVCTIAAWVPRLTHTSAPRVRASSSTISRISFALRLRAGKLTCIKCKRRLSAAEYSRARGFVCGARSCPGRVGSRKEKPHSINRERENRDYPDQMLEPTQEADHGFKLSSKQIPQRHNNRNRNDGAQQVVEEKPRRSHPERPGSQVDQGSKSGQKTSVEDGAMAVSMHEAADAIYLELRAGTGQTEVAHQPGAEVASQEEQGIVPCDHADERNCQGYRVAGDAAMDQEAARQQSYIFRHRKPEPA